MPLFLPPPLYRQPWSLTLSRPKPEPLDGTVLKFVDKGHKSDIVPWPRVRLLLSISALYHILPSPFPYSPKPLFHASSRRLASPRNVPAILRVSLALSCVRYLPHAFNTAGCRRYTFSRCERRSEKWVGWAAHNNVPLVFAHADDAVVNRFAG